MKRKYLALAMTIMMATVGTACGTNEADTNNVGTISDAVDNAAELAADGVESSEENTKETSEDMEKAAEASAVQLTISEYPAQEMPLQNYLYEMADVIVYEYEGSLSPVCPEYENICLSEEFSNVEIERNLYDQGAKIDYVFKCDGNKLFYTDQYDNYPNTVETFMFYDMDKDNIDEVLVKSYTESTAGFVVTAASIFKYNGSKWAENVVYTYDKGIITSDGVEEACIRDIVISEDQVVILSDDGEKDGADLTVELICRTFTLADSGLEFLSSDEGLVDKYWTKNIF